MRSVRGGTSGSLGFACSHTYRSVSSLGRAASQVLDQAVALRSNQITTHLADISAAARAYAGHPDADDLCSHIAALTAA
jgi:hypothetical protein